MGDIVIVSRHTAKEAIVSGHTINKIWVQEGIRKQQINGTSKNAKAQKLTIQTIPKSKLGNLANAPCQGIAIPIVSYEYADFDQFIQSQREKGGLSTVIILNGLEDPHSLGPIIRTADANGVNGVVIPKGRSVALTQAVVKASTGAIQHVLVMRVANLSGTIDELEGNGYQVAGAKADNATDYRNMAADMPLAIVIDSEGQGMNRLVKDKYDFYIKVPMVGHVNSLNASVAASLTMYGIYRKRHQIGDTQ